LVAENGFDFSSSCRGASPNGLIGPGRNDVVIDVLFITNKPPIWLIHIALLTADKSSVTVFPIIRLPM
ncbi:hypothetical protein IIC65_00980, partial [Candidatus Sumerlaeota bacterium]|nr:hypothetical protein [Candidatus Sumerlaeota bacterium]